MTERGSARAQSARADCFPLGHEAGRPAHQPETDGPEQAPVGDSPDAGGERLDLAAVGDDEAEAPGVAGDAAHGQRVGHF